MFKNGVYLLGKTHKGLSNMGYQTPALVTWGKDDAGMG